MLTNREEKWKERTGGRHLLMKGKRTVKNEAQQLDLGNLSHGNAFCQAVRGLCMQSPNAVI